MRFISNLQQKKIYENYHTVGSIINNIISKIKSLQKEPYPRGAKKIKDANNFWRIRIGSYRVIYEVNQDLKRINIYKIKHRRDAYK